MSLWTLLEDAAWAAPERCACIEGATVRSRGESARRCERLHAFLMSRGLGRGDRVSILDWNGIPYFESYYALARAGAILNPLNVRLSPGELATIVAHAGSRVLVASVTLEPLVRALAALETPLEEVIWTGGGAPVCGSLRVSEYEAAAACAEPVPEAAAAGDDDVAHLYYTSGTTGRPKGVMLTHGNVRTHAESAIAELRIGPEDRWAHIAPMFHLADAWATFAVTRAGGSHVFLPRFEAGAALEVLAGQGVSLTNLVPTMWNLMVKHPAASARRYPKLRLVLSGGAPIAPDLVRRIFETFGCEYAQTYGMTETSPYLTLGLLPPHLDALPERERLAWKAKTGRPYLGVELRVVHEDGTPVRADGGDVGEIRVRGPTVTPGYWRNPDATAAAFEDGWLKTGDLAVLDAEGFVDIVDRAKDVINTGAEKVYSIEVENVLYDHFAVLEAAAFARADALWGEVVCAAVVLRPGASASAEELRSWCRERLSSFKVPRVLEFLAELPKTGSGKIAKRLLRDARPAGR